MTRQSITFLQFLGSGMELVVWMMAFLALGAGLDSVLELETPWAKVVCGLLGFTFGMYNFVRRIQRTNRSPPDDKQSE